MKKVIITISILFILICMNVSYGYGINEEDILLENIDNRVFIVINDDLIEFVDTNPRIHLGTTYVPIRKFSEILGATVRWDKSNNYTYIEKEALSLILDNSNNILYTTDNQEIKLSILRDGNRVLVPYRFIGEYFGYQVSFIKRGPIARVKNENALMSDFEIVEYFKSEIVQEKQRMLEELESSQVVTYLTFDDGPNLHTMSILDLLKKYNMKATFFVLDKNLTTHPNIAKRIIEEGHSIGLHGVTHNVHKIYKDDTSVLSEMDINNNTLKRLLGISSKIIRVPYGSHPHLTNVQYRNLVNAGYKMWDWNIDSGDTRQGATSFRVKNHTINALSKFSSKRSVVLFHDNVITVRALEDILIWMKDHNYTSHPLTEKIKPYNWQ